MSSMAHLRSVFSLPSIMACSLWCSAYRPPLDYTLAVSPAPNKQPKNICWAVVKWKRFRSLYRWSPGKSQIEHETDKPVSIGDSYAIVLVSSFSISIEDFSQLSAISIMTIPTEVYSFGWQYMIIVPNMILIVGTVNYVFLPVFYNNNIDNCYMVSAKKHELNVWFVM